MMNRAARSFAVAGLALAAVMGVIAFSSTDAAAQGFNVFTFECTTGGDVKLDVRGLGNTNVCLVGTLDVNADCACANGGGNCPVDAKKQSFESSFTVGFALEPKNGRVLTTVDGGEATDICSDNLSCPGGQTAKTVISTVDASWTLCTTTAAAGETCTCGGSGQQALGTLSDGACDTSGVVFAGKKSSCLNLFQ